MNPSLLKRKDLSRISTELDSIFQNFQKRDLIRNIWPFLYEEGHILEVTPDGTA